VDNHDLPRAVTACGGDVVRVGEMLRFLFAIRGTPAITWGTEVALEGAGEPANRADMTWDSAMPLASVIREAHALRPNGSGGRVVELREDGFLYLRDDGQVVSVSEGAVHLEAPGDRSWDEGEGIARFEVSGAPVGEGDRLLVVGAGPELGNWDPAAGVPLPRESMSFPGGAVLDFKLVVQRADGSVVWEDRPNRYGLIEPGMSLHLALDWNG